MSLTNAIQTFSDNSDIILNSFESVCKQDEDICEEWHVTKLDEDVTLRKLCSDAKNEVTYNNIKIKREETICVVYGRVSSGKSTFINSIIERNILPTDNGSTTNSFVEIRKSDDNTDYVIFNDRPDRMDISSIKRVDFFEKSLLPGSNVKLYLSGNKCGILKDNVVIVDTPGIDTDVEIDTINNDICKQADILILVVNSANDINDTEMNFLLKHKTIFSKFNLLIVFNHWDRIKDPKKEYFEDEYKKSAKNFLYNDLRMKDCEDHERIFFISAMERSSITNNETINTIGFDERNRSFDCFLVSFNKYWCISNNERRLESKKEIFEIFTDTIKRIRIHRIKLLKNITDKVKESLSKLIDANEVINKAVDNLFAKYYEDYFNRGLDMIKQKYLTLESSTAMRHSFIFEQMTVMIESLKIIITDFVFKNDANDTSFIILTVEKSYFNHFIKANNSVEDIKSCDIYSTFKIRMKDILKESYSRFMENICYIIYMSISENNDDFNLLEKKVNQFKEKWDPLFMQTIDILGCLISVCDHILLGFHAQYNLYEDVFNEWLMWKNEEELVSCYKLNKDAKYEIIYNNMKLQRKEIICVVFGRISSGKSMLINAILGKEFLLTDNGSITETLHEVRKSDKGNNSDYLQGNVVIIDTPGIDVNVDMDASIHEMCKRADLLVLVVNSTNNISETDKNFLLKYKTRYSKFNLIIVFNHWDEIKESKKENLKIDYRKRASNFLRNDLGITDNDDVDRIFFISALERLNISQSEGHSAVEWEERNRSFDRFVSLCNKYTGASVENRLSKVKKTNIDIIMKEFDFIKDYRDNLQQRLTAKVKEALSKLPDMNEIINKTVETLFVQNYELFFHCGLDTIRFHQSDLYNAAYIINVFISEQMVVIVESLKIIINDLISGLEVEDKDFIMKIIKKLYFRYFVNVDIMIEIINKYDLHPVFKEIMTTIQWHRKVATAVLSVVGTVVIAPIGVAIGLVSPIIDVVAIPIAVVGCAGVGTIGGAISSKLVLMRKDMERAGFKPRYADHELHLLNCWDIMMKLLINSYNNFFDNLPTVISFVISNNGKDFTDLENEVNQFKEKWGY